MDIVTLSVGFWAVLVAVIDGWRQRVPNVLLLLALIPALLAVIVQGRGLLGAGVASSFAGMAVAGLIVLPGYIFGKMGAGDVKLAAVLGLLSGLSATPFWMLYAGIALGAMAVVIASLRYLLKASWKKFPAAVAIVVGFLSYLWWGRFVIA